MRINRVLLIIGLLTLAAVIPALALDGNKISFGDFLGWITYAGTALGGVLAALAAFMPSVSRVRNNFESLLKDIRSLVDKYKEDEQVRRDLHRLVVSLDLVTESIADVLQRVGLGKTAKTMRDIVQDDLLRALRD